MSYTIISGGDKRVSSENNKKKEAPTMKIYDEARYCECGTEISIQEDKFLNGLCESCYEKQATEEELLHTSWVEVPELVSRPAEIKTFAFEMNGKQYRTRSSLELLG